MTRETKIGLLVGLAFIIVIGILLSDHINSSTDPARADYTYTTRAVEQSVASPDQRNQGSMTVVTPPRAMIPQNPVPTMRDPLPANNGGSSVVVIGPGADPSSLPRPNRQPMVEPQPGGNGIQVLPPGNTEVATNDGGTETAVSGPLSNLIHEHGEDLAPVGGPVRLNPQPASPGGASGQARAPAAPLPPGVRQVKAEEGDTVTKLAIKYMGGNSRANREAIIRANPNVGADGHKMFAGQTYLIPASAAAAPVVVSSDQPRPAPRPAPKASPAPEPIPAGMSLYTVKENESLWKIASEQLGSGARYPEIRDLNQDVLKGSDAVRTGMRLKLPPKAVASTN
jgi:nucleoid-associated protein YgaU